MNVNKMGIAFIIGLSLTACVKEKNIRHAAPIQVQQPGDEAKDCTAIVSEMNGINEAVKRHEADTELNAKNIMSGKTGLGISKSGVVDLSEASAEEVTAYEQRYDYLDLVARRKRCY